MDNSFRAKYIRHGKDYFLSFLAAFAVGCVVGSFFPTTENFYLVALVTLLSFFIQLICLKTKYGSLIPVGILLSALFCYAALQLLAEYTPFLYLLFCVLLGIALYLFLQALASYRPSARAMRHISIGILLWAIGVFWILFSLIAVLRVKTYTSVCFDFGIFCQMFHSMREGLGPITTLERNTLLSHFSIHFSPIYYLMLPFYVLFPSPMTLAVLQILIVGASVLPAYLLCRQKGLSVGISSVLSAAILLHPALGGGCLYDLHENCFLTFFLLFLFYFWEKNRIPAAYICAALVMCVKEDAPVYVAFAALYFFATAFSSTPQQKKKKLLGSLGLFGVAISVFLLVTTLMRVYGHGIMTNRYENLIGSSGSLADLLSLVVRDPAAMLRALLNNSEKLTYLLCVLLPLSILPLFTKKWERLLLFGPLLLINLLPDYIYQHKLFFQYSFGSLAFLVFLAVLNIADFFLYASTFHLLLRTFVWCIAAFRCFAGKDDCAVTICQASTRLCSSRINTCQNSAAGLCQCLHLLYSSTFCP